MNTGSVLAQFTISLSMAVNEPVSVDWHTSDGSAKAGVDYAANSGTVIFAPGQIAKTVDILVYGRAVGTEDRTFYVEMLPPTNAILGASIGQCVIHVDTTGSQPVTEIIIPTGPRGIQGKSAYQTWLDMGNTGTEQDFINSLKPSAADIADDVLPLLNMGTAEVTASGTSSLSKPDKLTINDLARRVAYAAPVKIATVVLANGDNTVGQADMTGDTIDVSSAGVYPRIMRGTTIITPKWSVRTDGKLLIKSAVAGDVLYVFQYDFISAMKEVTNDRELWRRSIVEAGLSLVNGSFEEGASITTRTQAVWHIAGAQCYKWNGTLPKTVPQGSNPVSSGGISGSGWASVSSNSLKAALAAESNSFLVDDSNIKILQPTGVGAARTQHSKNAERVSLLDFGGVGDGVTNNDAAMAAAITYLQGLPGGGVLYIPTGRYRFNSTINVHSTEASPITIQGEGKAETVLIYGGSSTTVDFIYVEGSVFFTLRGVGMKSLTKMTAGHAVHLKYSSFNTLEDIAVSTQNDYPDNFNFYSGIYFDSTDFSTLDDFLLFTQHTGLKVSGVGAGQTQYPQYDLWCTRGKIAFCQFGVVVGGGFDNFYIDTCMITYNNTNVVVDNSLSSKYNGIVHFGAQCVIEHSQVGPNVYINDSLASNANSQITIASHVSHAKSDGIAVASYPNSGLSIKCPFIAYNGSAGINVADNSVVMDIANECRITNNAVYGIFATFPGFKVNMPNRLENNPTPYNANVTPKTNVIGVSNTNFNIISPTGTTQETATPIVTEFVLVNSNANPSAGIILPSGAFGRTVRIFNHSQAAMKIYPHIGGGINTGGTNNPISLPTSASVTLYCTGTLWFT